MDGSQWFEKEEPFTSRSPRPGLSRGAKILLILAIVGLEGIAGAECLEVWRTHGPEVDKVVKIVP